MLVGFTSSLYKRVSSVYFWFWISQTFTFHY